jgi:hypothetical protein
MSLHEPVHCLRGPQRVQLHRLTVVRVVAAGPTNFMVSVLDNRRVIVHNAVGGTVGDADLDGEIRINSALLTSIRIDEDTVGLDHSLVCRKSWWPFDPFKKPVSS